MTTLKTTVISEIDPPLTTGPLQVGSNWPGVFITGKDTFGWAEALRVAARALRRHAVGSRSFEIARVGNDLLRLRRLLRSSWLNAAQSDVFMEFLLANRCADYCARQSLPITNVWIDTEFNGFGGALISMALVDEHDKHAYFSLGCRVPVPWVAENVMPVLVIEPVTRQKARSLVRRFLNRHKRVNVIADWPEDIKHFCELLVNEGPCCLGTPPLTFDLQMDLGTTKSSLIPHNALEDARDLKRRYLNEVQRS